MALSSGISTSSDESSQSPLTADVSSTESAPHATNEIANDESGSYVSSAVNFIDNRMPLCLVRRLGYVVSKARSLQGDVLRIAGDRIEVFNEHCVVPIRRMMVSPVEDINAKLESFNTRLSAWGVPSKPCVEVICRGAAEMGRAADTIKGTVTDYYVRYYDGAAYYYAKVRVTRDEALDKVLTCRVTKTCLVTSTKGLDMWEQVLRRHLRMIRAVRRCVKRAAIEESLLETSPKSADQEPRSEVESPTIRMKRKRDSMEQHDESSSSDDDRTVSEIGHEL